MKRKAVKLRSGKLGRHDPRHPWIFRNQLLKTLDPAIRPGDIVSVVDAENKLLGRGYYNHHSEIAVRLLTFKDDAIDDRFFYARVADAVAKRQALLATTNAYRAVYSEADMLPGLIVDVYGDTAVFQILTFGMEAQEDVIVRAIRDIVKPKYLYEKSVSPYREIEGLKDVAKWWGEAGKPVIEITEGRVKFFVDIMRGHKTGFYLDQRRSRMALEQIAKGKRVLDLFCYTGGFSVSAAVYGASEVIGVDIKREWLELAEKNAALNGVGEKINFIEGDAFAVLKEAVKGGELFDVVILDPPSFLKTRSAIQTAARGYKEVNRHAISVLKPGGVLATFSCSHTMPNELFIGTIKQASEELKRPYTVLKRCHQAEDHPIVRSIPETEYLKGYFLKFA